MAGGTLLTISRCSTASWLYSPADSIRCRACPTGSSRQQYGEGAAVGVPQCGSAGLTTARYVGTGVVSAIRWTRALSQPLPTAEAALAPQFDDSGLGGDADGDPRTAGSCAPRPTGQKHPPCVP